MHARVLFNLVPRALAREKPPGNEVVYCFIARSTYLASYEKELLLTSFIPVNGQDFSPQEERSEGPLVLTKYFSSSMGEKDLQGTSV